MGKRIFLGFVLISCLSSITKGSKLYTSFSSVDNLNLILELHDDSTFFLGATKKDVAQGITFSMGTYNYAKGNLELTDCFLGIKTKLLLQGDRLIFKKGYRFLLNRTMSLSEEGDFSLYPFKNSVSPKLLCNAKSKFNNVSAGTYFVALHAGVAALSDSIFLKIKGNKYSYCLNKNRISEGTCYYGNDCVVLVDKNLNAKFYLKTDSRNTMQAITLPFLYRSETLLKR